MKLPKMTWLVGGCPDLDGYWYGTPKIEPDATFTVCFTVCLFIRPNSDGHRAPNKGSLTLRGMFHGVCFTICLFISPDIDGYRAPQIRH